MLLPHFCCVSSIMYYTNAENPILYRFTHAIVLSDLKKKKKRFFSARWILLYCSKPRLEQIPLWSGSSVWFSVQREQIHALSCTSLNQGTYQSPLSLFVSFLKVWPLSYSLYSVNKWGYSWADIHVQIISRYQHFQQMKLFSLFSYSSPTRFTPLLSSTLKASAS